MIGGFTFGRCFIASLGVAALVVYNSYVSREQFYPTCLHLVTSKGPMAILSNLLFFSFLLLGKSIHKMFLGELKDDEVEMLTDKLWGTAVDTLFVMTIFREEFNLRFISMFVILLFMKTNHWLSQHRVDFMQQMINVSSGKHLRLFSLMCFLFLFDSLFVFYAIHVSFKVPSMMILFGFEYLLLIGGLSVTMIKFIFNMKEMKSGEEWEKKGSYVLYLEFAGEFYRLLVYLAFFGVILMHYGIPLHIIRQLYYTFTSFKDRFVEVIKYRAAMKQLKTQFKNATKEEMDAAETCIVCRSELKEGKKLPCGHILHFNCLRSWLERRQSCPICMKPVLPDSNNDIPSSPVHININPPNQNVRLNNQNQTNEMIERIYHSNKEQNQTNAEIETTNIVSELKLIQIQLNQTQSTIQNLLRNLEPKNRKEEAELIEEALSQSLLDLSHSQRKLDKEN